MTFNEQEIKFLKLIAEWFEKNKIFVKREEAIKKSHIDGDTYEVLVRKMLHLGAIEKIESNMRGKKCAAFRTSPRAVELVREIESADNIKPKPPEMIQKILWIKMFGRKYWLLVFLMVLLFLILYLLPKLNLFGKDHQNVHPKAETSGDSSPAIITSGPNSPVTVHYDITQPSTVYRPVSADIKEIIIRDFQQIRNDYDIRVSVTSDKGNSSRQRVAEEVAEILIDAGFQAKLTQPIIRFSNDTSDVVIKYNENDTELVKDFHKALNKLLFKETSFSALKNMGLQRYELQIIIAGDPLFSSDGVITFQ